MNTTQLECFVTVATTLNFVRTAEQLNMSQPAVSRQIQSLETELGVRLLNRTTRSVTLTIIGQRFLPEASRMLQEWYHSRDWIATFQTHEEYALRIGYSDPNEMYRISTTLRDVLASYANITPEFILDQSDANMTKLAQNQVDLVLAEMDTRFKDESIAFHPLCKDRFACILSRKHPLAVQLLETDPDVNSISQHMLWGYRQILSVPAYLMRTYFSRGHRILPINENVSNCICANVNEAYGLVLAGIGYAFVPEHLLIPNPDLLFLKWNESPQNAFGLYCRKDAANQELLRDYIKMAESIY